MMRFKVVPAVFTVFLLLMPFRAQAQNRDEFSNQVEVTREYDPEVAEAVKIAIAPNMADTVLLRPSVSYSITPSRWETAFGLRPINAAGISMADYDPHRPFYLRIGAGYPLKSLADLYFSAPMNSRSMFGMFLNHDGQWGKIENEKGDRKDATAVENRLGVYFAKQYADNRRLALDAGFINRQYKPYGAFELPAMPLSDYYGNDKLFGYNDAAVKFAYGDAFADMTRLNFRFGLEGGFFAGDGNNRQADMDLSVRLGQSLGYGTLIADAEFDYVKGLSAMSDYDNYTVGIAPQYRIDGTRLTFALGAGLMYDSRFREGTFFFVPKVELSYFVAPAFIPYLTLDGDLQRNDYKSLSYANPYILNGTGAGNGVVWRAKAGFGGSVGEVFTYDLYFGGEDWREYRLFANVYSVAEGSTRFTAMNVERVQIYYPGLGINVVLARGLNIRLSGQYNITSAGDMVYHGTSVRPGLGIPDYEMNAGLHYSFRDKFYLSVDAVFSGDAEYSIVDSPANPSHYTFWNDDAPGDINLRLEAEYRVRNGFSVFVRGENLLNQNRSTYNRYPLQGIGFMGGIKLAF